MTLEDVTRPVEYRGVPDLPYYKGQHLPNHAPNQQPKPRVTRLDFTQMNEGTQVAKYAEGWTSSTPAIERRVVPPTEMTYSQMLDWCKANGWTVREWYYGARAFKGTPQPIRTTGQILQKRRQLERYPDRLLNMTVVDLAFDL